MMQCVHNMLGMHTPLGDFLKRTPLIAIASLQRGEVGGENGGGSARAAARSPAVPPPTCLPPLGEVHIGKHRVGISGEPFPGITLVLHPMARQPPRDSCSGLARPLRAALGELAA